jgi:hypothetical protein
MCHLGMSLSLLWWGLQNSDNSRFKCSSQGRRKLRTYVCIHIPGKHMGRRNYRQFCSTHMREKPAANLGLTFIIPPDTHFTLKVARSTYIQGNLTYGSCGSWFGMAPCPKPRIDHGFMFAMLTVFLTESCVYSIYIYRIFLGWLEIKSARESHSLDFWAVWQPQISELDVLLFFWDNPKWVQTMISSLFIIFSHSYPQGGPLVISWFINFTAYIVSYIYIYLYINIYIYIMSYLT